MKFTKGGSTFTFVDGRKYPIDDQPQVNVVVDYSEGKQLYAYDKGVEETFIYLDLDRICQTDEDNLNAWFTDTAVGPKNTFTFTDEEMESYLLDGVPLPTKVVPANFDDKFTGEVKNLIDTQIPE